MIKQQLISTSKYNVKCPYTMTPTGICVHNTANDAPAKNEISYMGSNNNEVSFHIAVDDIEAIQGIPFNRNAWHAGDGGSGQGNMKHIGIEICYSKSGGERFVNAEKRAAKVIAKLLKDYNWGIDKVKKHQDFSGKYCPHRTLDTGWSRFINMIKSELTGTSTPSKPSTSDLYRVRKSWGDSASQKGAFSSLDNAKKECDKHSGYSVFDKNGSVAYTKTSSTPPGTPGKYLNLHKHVPTWRVYRTNVSPVVGNECGSLAPQRYGGLSYKIVADKGDVKHITTETFGTVQIYAPRDADSSITSTPIY